MKAVGLDLSLTSSGVATALWPVTGLPPEVTVRRVGSIGKQTDTLAMRSGRLRTLAHGIATRCAGASLVIVEGPAYGQTSGHAHDRSGLWWLVIARLTANSIPVVEVTTQQLKMYATGKGNGSKDATLAAVVRRYPHIDVTGNDEADALTLLAMGARHLGRPIEPEMPAAHLRALAKVAWPA